MSFPFGARVSSQPSLIDRWNDLTNLDSAIKIPPFSLVMGFIAGIIVLTGFDISPEGIFQTAAGAIFQTFSNLIGAGYLIVIWYVIVIILGIIGAAEAYKQIRVIVEYGLGGVVSSIAGFLAGFIVIVSSGSPLVGYVFIALFLASLGSAVFAR